MDALFLSAAQVRRRYGGVSEMWLFRREREPNKTNPHSGPEILATVRA
jgi:hypothetical protein